MADEDLVLDLDAVADERMARDLAGGPDHGSCLDLHERADPGVVADPAAVQVREGPHEDALTELHVADETERRLVCRLIGQIRQDGTAFRGVLAPRRRAASRRAERLVSIP